MRVYTHTHTYISHVFTKTCRHVFLCITDVSAMNIQMYLLVLFEPLLGHCDIHFDESGQLANVVRLAVGCRVGVGKSRPGIRFAAGQPAGG